MGKEDEGHVENSSSIAFLLFQLNDRIHDLEKEKEILREANEKLLNR